MKLRRFETNEAHFRKRKGVERVPAMEIITVNGKAQNSRTSGGVRLYHQGGNLPYYRKLPFMRCGFRSINRVRYASEPRKNEHFRIDTEITPEITAGIGHY